MSKIGDVIEVVPHGERLPVKGTIVGMNPHGGVVVRSPDGNTRWYARLANIKHPATNTAPEKQRRVPNDTPLSELPAFLQRATRQPSERAHG